MLKIKKHILGLILILLSGSAFSQYKVAPFYTHNQSPLIHFFGLQGNEGGALLETGEFIFHNHINLVSNASAKRFYNERVYLDGEMYRMDFSVRYGFLDWLELGIDLPLVRHTTGGLDHLISSWHEAFNLPGKARSQMPYNEMGYFYSFNGNKIVSLEQPSSGLGDVSLLGAFKLLNRKGHTLCLRTALKLPTGNKRQLIGSGSTDFSVQLNGTIGSVNGYRGTLFYYSGGILFPGQGGLLEEIQRSRVGFGSLGWAFGIQHRLVPKLQLDWNGPFYRESSTKQLGKASVQVGFGAEFVLNPKTGFELGIVEDLVANTAPDIVIQLSFTRRL
ncbi:MAG: DUF3187 family protein [Marinifilaceae bacterium]